LPLRIVAGALAFGALPLHSFLLGTFSLDTFSLGALPLGTFLLGALPLGTFSLGASSPRRAKSLGMCGASLFFSFGLVGARLLTISRFPRQRCRPSCRGAFERSRDSSRGTAGKLENLHQQTGRRPVPPAKRCTQAG